MAQGCLGLELGLVMALPPCVSLSTSLTWFHLAHEGRGWGHLGRPSARLLPTGLLTDSEARPWPRKCSHRTKRPPLPPALPTPDLPTRVGGPDSWLHLRPKSLLCIHGINFPKELLSEFDLREPSISPENHHLSRLTPRHSTFQLIHQEALFNNEQRDSRPTRPATGQQPTRTCSPHATPHPLNSFEGNSSGSTVEKERD